MNESNKSNESNESNESANSNDSNESNDSADSDDDKSKKKTKTATKIGNKKVQVFERRILNMKKVEKILNQYSVFVLNINRYKLFKQIF